MLNQHYLDIMFASDADGRTLDANEFMESEIRFPIPQLGERLNEKELDLQSVVAMARQRMIFVAPTAAILTLPHGR